MSSKFTITLDAKDVLRNLNRTQAAERADKWRFCFQWPWSLTFDLDLQTRPSEGPNTSSVWIWRKSVQRFPRYFIHKQKTQTDGAKNRTSRSSLRAVIVVKVDTQRTIDESLHFTVVASSDYTVANNTSFFGLPCSLPGVVYQAICFTFASSSAFTAPIQETAIRQVNHDLSVASVACHCLFNGLISGRDVA